MSQHDNTGNTDVIRGSHNKDLEWQQDTSDNLQTSCDTSEEHHQQQQASLAHTTERDFRSASPHATVERNPSFRGRVDRSNSLASTLGKMSDQDILEYMNKRTSKGAESETPRQSQSPRSKWRSASGRITQQRIERDEDHCHPDSPTAATHVELRDLATHLSETASSTRSRPDRQKSKKNAKPQRRNSGSKVMRDFLSKFMHSSGPTVEDLEIGVEKKKAAGGSSDGTDTVETGSHFGHDEIGKVALAFVWVTVAFMGLGSLVTFIFWLNAENDDDRAMFGFTFVITLLAMFAYICKGLGQGTWITSEGKSISWARYADWVITTPLLVVDMCKLAHAPASTTQMLVCLDIVMITLGVASAMTHSQVRSLVWFAASGAMYIVMVVLIQSELGTAIESQGEEVKSLFQIFKTMTLATWSFYPVVVLLGDQNAFCSCGIISHDAESIALSVLDIIAKVGVEILLVAMKVTSHAGPAAAIAINGTAAVAMVGQGAH